MVTNRGFDVAGFTTISELGSEARAIPRSFGPSIMRRSGCARCRTASGHEDFVEARCRLNRAGFPRLASETVSPSMQYRAPPLRHTNRRASAVQRVDPSGGALIRPGL